MAKVGVLYLSERDPARSGEHKLYEMGSLLVEDSGDKERLKKYFRPLGS